MNQLELYFRFVSNKEIQTAILFILWKFYCFRSSQFYKMHKKAIVLNKYLLKVLDTKTTNQFEHIGFHKFELNFYPTKSVPTKF